MTTLNTEETVEKLDHSHIAVEKVKRDSLSGKHFLKELGMRLPYDPSTVRWEWKTSL